MCAHMCTYVFICEFICMCVCIYKTLLWKLQNSLKEIKGLYKWTCHDYVLKDNIKRAVVPKLIYGVNAISVRIAAGFAEIDKPILKYIWTLKKPRRAENILKKNKTEGLTIPNSKSYYKETNKDNVELK